MSKRSKRKFPKALQQRLQEVAVAEGSQSAAARALNTPLSTFARALKGVPAGPLAIERLQRAAAAWRPPAGTQPAPPRPKQAPIVRRLAELLEAPAVDGEQLDRIERKLDALLAAWGVEA